MAGGLGNLRPCAHYELRRVSELAVCHFGDDCGGFLRAGMAADRLNFRVSAGPHAGQHNLALLLPNVVKLTKVVLRLRSLSIGPHRRAGLAPRRRASWGYARRDTRCDPLPPPGA